MIPQPEALAKLPNRRNIPVSLQRLRVATVRVQGKFVNRTTTQIARQVDQTEVSQPPIWRKGPMPAINPGWQCWVLTFDNWPHCVIHKALVQHVDLTEKLYIVNIEGRKWAVSSERVFKQKAAAEQEAEIYETINQALYLTPADGAYEEPELDLKPIVAKSAGETKDECEQSNFGW